MRIKKVFGQDKKGTRPLTPKDKSAGDDLVNQIYERKFSNRVPTDAKPTSSVEQRKESKGRQSLRLEWTSVVGLIVNADPPAYR